MTISIAKASKLRKLIRELCRAEREDEMKGSHPPETAAKIVENLRVARKRVSDHIDMLCLDDFRRAP